MASFTPPGLVQWTDHMVSGPPEPAWTLEKTENSLVPVGKQDL